MSRSLIAILDYGMGNLHSAKSAFDHLGENIEVIITDQAEQVRQADRVVFPGVGAIRDCMAEIKRLGFDKLVAEQVKEKPVLAICVGMQALLSHSTENGGVDCIGLFDGEVVKFDEHARDANGDRLKVPHMGWNQVEHNDHPMWQKIDSGERFYFVHSYHARPKDPSVVSARSEYGIEFACALNAANLFAVQFHPEKSQHAGLQLLQNFIHWDGQS